MSFTNHTPNYNLPQYVGTDKPTFLGDFNNAMTAIDTALHNNAQNAGEGLSELQQAQAALTETQETLSEVQTEVANVSGIAATVNQNVQQALTAANDATTAANSATSQIQPAVTAANQASADAQAAQQVANGNVATLNDLSERVTALENAAVTEITGSIPSQGNASRYGWVVKAPSGHKISSIEITPENGTSDTESYIYVFGNPPETVSVESGTEIGSVPLGEKNLRTFNVSESNYTSVGFQLRMTSGFYNNYTSYAVKFEKL